MKVVVSIFPDDNATDSRLFDKKRFDMADESYLEPVSEEIKEYLSEQYFEMSEEGV